jgi:benzoyl-CoA reductase/2-hydroxyglutaryl-CoA dehydratase subunit BcrC/BadD/HgdB
MDQSSGAATRLAWHYENPMAAALDAHAAGTPVVGITSNTIPWELVRAAGFFPVMLDPTEMKTPTADEFMEPGVFQARIRRIFESVVSGEFDFLRAIICSRTSEQEYKLFLYLKEVARERPGQEMPPVYLYDLLHTQSEESRTYGLGRTEKLKQELETMAGRAMKNFDLLRAIEESNAARAAVVRLLRLRTSAQRLSGTEAIPLVGAFWLMNRGEYVKLASDAADLFERRAPMTGARVLVAGAPLDRAPLHAAIEAHGAIVTVEDDWRGTRSAGPNIQAGNHPMPAIFEHYFSWAPSPRVFPMDLEDEWFANAVTKVDGVVFYLPRQEYVAGWSYPRRKRWLDETGIPNILITEDAGAGELSAGARQSITEFARVAARKRETHG